LSSSRGSSVGKAILNKGPAKVTQVLLM